MTNMRGKRVIILRSNWYYFELFVLFFFGSITGWYVNETYTMVDDYINGEPINYICKGGKVYEQADPVSTVYIKTNKECIEGV